MEVYFNHLLQNEQFGGKPRGFITQNLPKISLQTQPDLNGKYALCCSNDTASKYGYERISCEIFVLIFCQTAQFFRGKKWEPSMGKLRKSIITFHLYFL